MFMLYVEIDWEYSFRCDCVDQKFEHKNIQIISIVAFWVFTVYILLFQKILSGNNLVIILFHCSTSFEEDHHFDIQCDIEMHKMYLKYVKLFL